MYSEHFFGAPPAGPYRLPISLFWAPIGCLDTTVDKSVEKLSGGGCGGPGGGFGGPWGGFLILVAVVACHYLYKTTPRTTKTTNGAILGRA